MKAMQVKDLDSSSGIGDSAILNLQKEMEQFEAEERKRLGVEDASQDQWVENQQLNFSASQREHTTLLVSGLTLAHDLFLQAALQGRGYKVEVLDYADNDSLRLGKEFGNRGQCNPTYFTVGNLVRHLQRLRDKKGLTPEEINKGYLFLTANGCGPCRFAMYSTEYRKALRDAGFDGFRVLAASQLGGADQEIGDGNGLEVTPRLFMGVIAAFLVGDNLNAQMYRIRPYELEAGATDAAIERCRELIMTALRECKSLLKAMWRVRKELAAIKVDRSMIKPRVSIIGEFWAMTTEGDGNYHLQRFLESEGAEVDIQLMVSWILYLNWEVKYDTKVRSKLRQSDAGSKGIKGMNWRLILGVTWLIDKVTRVVFYSVARFMGLRDYYIPDMDELAAVSHPFYSNELRGGEGHMEVGKLIQNVAHNKVNMTLSVKPFGCMPSGGVSDGVQSIITEMYPQAIYLPIETSGDGAVNVHSRVQMQLFKARQVAQQEVQEAREAYGLTKEMVRETLERFPSLNHAFNRSPHRAGCTAADQIHEVGRKLGRRFKTPELATAE